MSNYGSFHNSRTYHNDERRNGVEQLLTQNEPTVLCVSDLQSGSLLSALGESFELAQCFRFFSEFSSDRHVPLSLPALWLS